MNYDYSGLINLALVTIIYSSFIGPSLKRLGELKDEIANIDFPVIDDGTGQSKEKTDELISTSGTLLDKKLTQYSDKHHEIKVFLYFFYAILVLIFVFQISLMVLSNSYPINQIMSLLSAGLIIVLLAISINVYMVRPWKLRSFRWLAVNGVSSVYTNRLVKSELMINGTTTNSINKGDSIDISIRQRAKFIGYKYILLVEGSDKERLYYIAAGDIGKRTVLSPLLYDNGAIGYEFRVGRVKLKEGTYSARLIIFSAPYGGKYNASETILEFTVEDKRVTNLSKSIKFEDKKTNYTFNGSAYTKRFLVSNISFGESFSGDKNIIPILASKRFIYLVNKLPRPFTLSSLNGSLDRHFVEKYISKRFVLWARVRRIFTIKRKRSTAYSLIRNI